MPRLSMNEMTTYRWSFEEDVVRYAAAGFAAIGVWRQKLSDYGEDKGIELLRESGLSVSNLLWAGGFTGSEGHSFRDSVADASEAVELAAAMNAGCLIVYSGARHGHTRTHASRLLRDALRELEPMAATFGVTLAVEPMHPGCADHWTFLTEIDETLELLEQVASPCVRLAFDTYHLGHDESILDRIGSFADRIAVVHLGDGRVPPEVEQNRCRLGDGTLPLRELIAALSAAGYDGDYDVELMGEEIEASNYQELLFQSKQAFIDLIRPGAALSR